MNGLVRDSKVKSFPQLTKYVEGKGIKKVEKTKDGPPHKQGGFKLTLMEP